MNKLQIEKAEYEQFAKSFAESEESRHLRYGQAFYNHFKLNKLANQDQLLNLYEKDGNRALETIHQVFDFV